MSNFDDSEIINQKKQFIFKVTQSSNYVFPNEEFRYYIFIKNISGTEIKNFRINIENPQEIVFEEEINPQSFVFNIKDNEVKLYELKAYSPLIGKHTVHFIGYGDETAILYNTLKIQCTRSYNSDSLLHRISIYDFTPYEDNYSMEAEDYNTETAQIFKKQKLPYPHGTEDEGKYIKELDMQKNFLPENIESQSFLDQYDKARNSKNHKSKEHVYQYLSRENFTEDSKESYTGKNLFEIFEKINKKSEYFKGKFFRSGTNHLKNDFIQYSPNGFIYRMGLLNSEIYHNLGVIPTYSYMSDRLFRWAPSKNQLLDITPKREAMKWGENIWAGRGWIVYRNITEEYEETEECRQKLENHLIKRREKIGVFDDKRTAEEVIRRFQHGDDIERTNQRSNLVKYEYRMEESLYDTGVFFVNIPVNQIPSNFYLLSSQSLKDIVNRAKPYGTKPIINYIIENTFDHNLEQIPHLNYKKHFLIDVQNPNIKHNITQREYKIVNICGTEIQQPSLIPSRVLINNYNDFDHDIEMKTQTPKVKLNKTSKFDVQEESLIYHSKTDYKLHTLRDILEVLYQGNYNNISFKINSKFFSPFGAKQDSEYFYTDENKNIHLMSKNNNAPFDKHFESLKLRIKNITMFKDGNTKMNMIIKDVLNKKHKVEISYDKDLDSTLITYSYINTNNQEFIRQKGYQNILSMTVSIAELYNKKILLFMVEEDTKERCLHYFHHVVVQDIETLEANKIVNDEKTNILEDILYAENIFIKDVIFETPFVKKSQSFQPKLLKGGENWDKIYRFNDKENSYSYIKNVTNKYLEPKDIYLCYDQINIPETAIIDKLRLKLIGAKSSNNKVYVDNALNTSYLIKEMNGNKIQFTPNKLECYSHFKESSVFYQTKLDISIKKEQESFIKKYRKLLEENIIFDEDMDVNINDYINNPNDFIKIKNEAWYELSEFTDFDYKLNEVSSISFIIEGYNTEREEEIIVETLSQTEHSSPVTTKIPSGYFRKKINLLFPNKFLLEVLRLRFRFKSLQHVIKIFDTKIEVNFKNKQENNIEYEYADEIDINNNVVKILENYYNPADINNGTVVKLSFDDLRPGGYYHLNLAELEVIYTETDIDIMVNKKKYQNNFDENRFGLSGIVKNGILAEFNICQNCGFYNEAEAKNCVKCNHNIETSKGGGILKKFNICPKCDFYNRDDSRFCENCQNNIESVYLSGVFYNDVPTMMQLDDNVGVENKGIKLRDALYQSFETRDDNITSIEIFPYSFKGNPDETLKIGLYTNSYNTPGKLLKEVLVNGWVKNNPELRDLDRIKYNFNINNLKVNEKYWFKIQVLNPRENSYYLLKGIDDTKPGFKLLADENNNYINTLSNLKFNIYSQNLSQSFNQIPILQDELDDPYVIIGLHKGLGSIEKLETIKHIKSVHGNDAMSNVFDNKFPKETIMIIKETGKEDRRIKIEEEDE